MWFTNCSDVWDPSKGYNSAFAEVVRQIRSLFQTQKQKAGVEVGTGYWRPFQGRAGNFFVRVSQFTWDGYRTIGGTVTPVLRLDLVIGKVAGEVVADFPLEITFPADFPQQPPVFGVDSHNYKHEIHQKYGEHHVVEGGVLCIFNTHGYTGNTWNPGTDTIVSAINVALDHLTWHYSQFGW